MVLIQELSVNLEPGCRVRCFPGELFTRVRPTRRHVRVDGTLVVDPLDMSLVREADMF